VVKKLEELSMCGTSCGGVIVDKNHILSAAHCFEDGEDGPLNVTNVLVYVGSTKQNMGTMYKVKNVKIHESYETAKYINDIAVITLSQDIKMGKNVAVACFPTEPVKNYVGQTLIVSGWGKMRDNKPTEDLQVSENLEIVAECPKREVG